MPYRDQRNWCLIGTREYICVCVAQIDCFCCVFTDEGSLHTRNSWFKQYCAACVYCVHHLNRNQPKLTETQDFVIGGGLQLPLYKLYFSDLQCKLYASKLTISKLPFSEKINEIG